MTFRFVHPQCQRLFQKPSDALHHALSGSDAFHEDDKIVRVADEAMLPLLQLFVQFISQDIRADGRQRTALRTALRRPVQAAIDADAGAKIRANQPQHPLVMDVPRHPTHLHRVCTRIKTIPRPFRSVLHHVPPMTVGVGLL